MKQSNIVLIAVLTVLCIIPMTAWESDATNPPEEDPVAPEVPEDPETTEGYDNSKRVWGYLGLIFALGLILFILYLEHKGILKDPML
jgi:hypothetical protein